MCAWAIDLDIASTNYSRQEFGVLDGSDVDFASGGCTECCGSGRPGITTELHEQHGQRNQILHMNSSKRDQRGTTRDWSSWYYPPKQQSSAWNWRPHSRNKGHLYGIRGSNNNKARQLRTRADFRKFVASLLYRNTPNARVLQSRDSRVIVASFFPLRIIQCRYMVRETMRT
jgi:hypothetical protein